MKILCDTHVHCYEIGEFSGLLDSAWCNFSKQAAAYSDADDGAEFVIFLADGEMDKTWGVIYPAAENNTLFGDWRLSLNGDSSLVVARDLDKQIHIAPGRQINSLNKLEFLLLGASGDIDNGQTEQEIIKNYSEQTVLICPWGAGKWLAKRSRVLSQLLASRGDEFFLGDNGGRPGLWAWVPHFKKSTKAILNGSDPLPLKGDIGRVGGFGINFQYDEGVGLSLKGLVESIKTTEIKRYGRPLSLMNFVNKQFRLRS